VRLPLAESPDLDEAASAQADAGTLPLAGLSILVVEDSDDTRESLRALLQHLGAEVSVACDGREALDMMKRGAKPDVVLCDLLMPRMDGFEFVRELEDRPVHPPVIAVSGVASEASRLRTREAGFDGHIKKPFDEAAIVQAVEAVIGSRSVNRV
jgi:CheY-like chemotaxis protein